MPPRRQLCDLERSAQAGVITERLIHVCSCCIFPFWVPEESGPAFLCLQVFASDNHRFLAFLLNAELKGIALGQVGRPVRGGSRLPGRVQRKSPVSSARMT